MLANTAAGRDLSCGRPTTVFYPAAVLRFAIKTSTSTPGVARIFPVKASRRCARLATRIGLRGSAVSYQADSSLKPLEAPVVSAHFILYPSYFQVLSFSPEMNNTSWASIVLAGVSARIYGVGKPLAIIKGEICLGNQNCRPTKSHDGYHFWHQVTTRTEG